MPTDTYLLQLKLFLGATLYLLGLGLGLGGVCGNPMTNNNFLFVLCHK
jgi:hypothetical protein